MSPRIAFAALGLALSLGACQPKSQPKSQTGPSAPPTASAPRSEWAEKTSFYEVAKHLDQGGSIYGYISTESLLAQSAAKAADIKEVLLKTSALDPDNQTKIKQGIESLYSLVSRIGIGEISGAGFSSVALEPEFFRTRSILHHYPDKGAGLIWNFAGKSASAGEIAGYLPQTTAIASATNIDLALLWKTIETEAASVPEARAALEQFSKTAEQATQLPLSQILSALGPQAALIVTLDESRKTSIPMDDVTVTAPEPGTALLLECNDPAVTKKITETLETVPNVQTSESDGVKYYAMAVPLPLPYVRPTVAIKGNMIVLGSFEALVREMFAVKAGTKPGLGANPEFVKAMTGLPSKVSSYLVVTPIFANTIKEIQKAVATKEKDPQVTALIDKLQAGTIAQLSIAVSESTPDGWVNTVHGPNSATPVIAAAALAPVGMMSAIAVPSFLRARSRSQAVKVLQEARLIDVVVDQWAVEHNQKLGTQPTTTDLLPYFTKGHPDIAKRMQESPGSTRFNAPSEEGEWVIPKVDDPVRIPPQAVERHREVVQPDFWKPYVTE